MNKFQSLKQKYNFNMRNKEKLSAVPSNTALMNNSIFCMAPKIYNKLPNTVKDNTLLSFKHKLKAFLCNKCYYSISDYLNDIKL